MHILFLIFSLVVCVNARPTPLEPRQVYVQCFMKWLYCVQNCGGFGDAPCEDQCTAYLCGLRSVGDGI